MIKQHSLITFLLYTGEKKKLVKFFISDWWGKKFEFLRDETKGTP